MTWRPDPGHTAAWSAVGGVVTIVATGATLTLAREPATAHVSSWLVYGCGALSLIGIYLMIAPLAHWWPWSSGIKPARDNSRSGGGGQRHARLAGGLFVAASIAAALVALVSGGSKNLATAGHLKLDAEQQRGRDLYAQACTRCHTLAAVDSVPRVWFSANLDVVMNRLGGSTAYRQLQVLDAIVEGSVGPGGRMPAKLFVGKDAQDVADFVSAAAGRDLSTGTASTAVLPPREVELNKIALNPYGPASRSTGSAYVYSEGSKYMLTLQLEHLPPSNGFSYAVWLVGSDSRLVGELDPVVSDEHLQAEARLPADAGNYHTLLLTKETSERPTQPGALVLSGPFTLAEPIQGTGPVSLSLKGEIEPVYVCLLGDNEQTLIPGIMLQAGERTPTYHAKGFEITLGNGPVTMFVNGKARIVEPFNQKTSYSITKTRGIQPLPAGQLPTCR